MDDVTLTLVAPYVKKSMDQVMLMPNGTVLREFTTRAQGFADAKAAALARVHQEDHGRSFCVPV